MRHFQLDSILLVEVRGDTALWRAWGKEPNWVRWIEESGTGEPTAADIAALPRVTTSHELVLLREARRWWIPLDAEAAAPALALRDSMVRHCPYRSDPRLCRPIATRLLQASQTLGIHHERLAFLAELASDELADAAAMDSVAVENITGGVKPLGMDSFTDVRFTIRNRSSFPLELVWYRVLGANGEVLDSTGAVVDVPPRGTKDGIYFSMGSRVGPYTIEITHLTVDSIQ